MLGTMTTTILATMQLFPASSIPAFVVLMIAAASIGIIQCGFGKKKGRKMKAKKKKKAPKKNVPKREKKDGVIVPQTAQALPKKKGKGKGSSKSLGKAKQQQQQIKPPERGIIVPMTIQTINIDGNAPESDEEEQQKYPQQQDAQAEINEEHVEEQIFAPPAAPAVPAPGPEETPEEITRQGMAQQGDVQYNTLADLNVAIFEEGGQPQPNDGDYE